MPELDNLNIGQLKEVAENIEKGNIKLNPTSFPVSRITPVTEFSQYDRGFIPDLSYDENDNYANLLQHRAEEQPYVDKLGNMLTRGVAKAAISVIEPLGYLLDFEQMFTDVNEYEEEYGNAFNNWLISLEESLDKELPIYTKEEQPGLLTPDWWVKNGDQMLKSVGYFLPAAGLTKGVGMLLKSSGIFEAIGATALQAAKARKIASPLIAVTGMNYNEHMRSAAEMYGQSRELYYNDFVEKGTKDLDKQLQAGEISEDEYRFQLDNLTNEATKEAKVKAANDAASIIEKGKLNIPLELIEYLTLFKYMGGTRAFTGKSLSALTKDFSKIGQVGLAATAKETGKDLLTTGLSEYLQEVNTGFFEDESLRQTKKNIGVSVDDQSTATRYLQRLGSYESLTEGLSGFIGGAGMQVISNVASHTARNAAKENIKRQAEMLGNPKKFEEATIHQFIDNIVIPSFQSGTTGNIQNVLTAIQQFTPEQAAKHEFAGNYVEKANEFKKIATELEEEYNSMSALDQATGTERSRLFTLKRNNVIARNIIDKNQFELEELTKRLNKDELNNDLRPFKDLNQDIAAVNFAILDAQETLKTIPEGLPHPLTNESREDIVSKIDDLISKRETLKNKQAKILETYINKNVEPVKTDNGIQKYKIQVNDDGGLDMVGVETKASTDLVKSIQSYINNNSSIDSNIGYRKQVIEQNKAVRDTTDKLYNLYKNNPAELKKYNERVKKFRDTYIGQKIQNISDAKTVTEVDQIIKDEQEPVIQQAASARRDQIKNEDKAIKEKLEDESKLSRKTTQEGRKVDKIEDITTESTKDGVNNTTETKGDTTTNNADNTTPPPTHSFSSGNPPLSSSNTTTPSVSDSQGVAEDNSTSFKPNSPTPKIVEQDGKSYLDYVSPVKAVNDYVNLVNTKGEATQEDMIKFKNSFEDDYYKEVPTARDRMDMFHEAIDVLESLENLFTNDPVLSNIPAFRDLASMEVEGIGKVRFLNNLATHYKKLLGATERSSQSVVGLEDNKPNTLPDEENNNESSITIVSANEDVYEGMSGRTLRDNRVANYKDVNYYQVNSATAVAYLDKDYIVDKRGVIHSISNTIIDRKRPFHSAKKDFKVRFVIDKDYPFQAEVGTDEYRNNVPIKIQMLDKGEWVDTDSYIHDLKWVEKNAFDIYTKDGVIENRKHQIDRIIQIRNKVLSNTEQGIDTLGEIKDVGKYNISRTIKYTTNKNGVSIPHIDSKTGKPYFELRKMSKAIPGFARFGFIKNGGIYINKDTVLDEKQVESLGHKMFEKNGLLLALIPWYGGKYNYLPMATNYFKPVGVPNTDLERIYTRYLRSMVKAADLFYSNEELTGRKGEILQREVEVGYKSDKADTRRVGTLIDYLSNFIRIDKTRKNVNLKPNSNNEIDYRIGVDARGNLTFGNTEDQVFYNVSYDSKKQEYVFKKSKPGDSWADAKEVSKKEWLREFEKVIANNRLNVDINLLGKSGKFELPIFSEQGNVKTDNYKSYEEFLKENIFTDINGEHNINGILTPFVQPNIQFSVDGIAGEVVNIEELEKKSIEENINKIANEKIEGLNDEDYDILDELFPDSSIVFKSIDYTKYEDISQDAIEFNPPFESPIEQKVVTRSLLSPIIQALYNKQSKVGVDEVRNNLTKINSLINVYYTTLNHSVNNDYSTKGFNILKGLVIPNLNLSEANINDDNVRLEILRLRDLYERLSNEFNSFRETLVEEFRDIGLIKEDAEVEQETDTETFKDKVKSLETDPKTNSSKFRLLLYSLPNYEYVDGEYRVKYNRFGLRDSVEVDELYEDLLKDLSGKTKNLQSAIDILQEYVKYKPHYKRVIDLLKSEDRNNFNESFKTLFINNILQAKEDLTKILIEKNTYGESGVTYTRVTPIDLSDQNGYKAIIRGWGALLKTQALANPGLQNSFINYEDDKYTINFDYVRNLQLEFAKLYVEGEQLIANGESLLEGEFIEKVVKVFDKIGISTDSKSLVDFVNRQTLIETRTTAGNSNWLMKNISPVFDQTSSSNGIVGEMFKMILNKQDVVTDQGEVTVYVADDTISREGIFTDEMFNYPHSIFNKYIIPLAKATYDNNNVLFSLNVTNSANNNIWIIQKYSRVSSIFEQIKSNSSPYLENLKQISITKNNPFIDTLINDKSFKDSFGYTLFDQLDITKSIDGNKRNSNTERSDQLEELQNTAALSLFQNKGKNTMMILAPTFGDSSKSLVVKMNRNRNIKFTVNKDLSVSLDSKFIDYMYKFVKGEMRRIYKSRNSNNAKSNEYKLGSTRFIQFDWLDYQNLSERVGKLEEGAFLTQAEYNKLYTKDNILKIDRGAIEIVKTLLNRKLTNDIENQLADFIKFGNISTGTGNIINYQTSILDKDYAKSIEESYNNNQKIKHLIADFTLNSYVNNIGLTNLFIVDPAHFTKSKDGIINFNATKESIQKRLKSALSPTIVGNFETNNYRRLIINDSVTAEEALKSIGYENISATDGFEWISDREHVEYLKAYDLISYSQYQSIINKINEAKGGYYELSADEVEAITVLKPMSFTSRLDIESDTIYPALSKSSFMGMFPQFTRQFPNLERIRKLMYDRNIQRVSYDSAVKIKDSRVVEVYDNNGEMLEDWEANILNTDITTNNRDFDGLQSISPYGKTKILNVIQSDRNIFAGLPDDTEFNYNGKTVSKIELLKEKELARKLQLKYGYERLKNKLGITIDKDGNMVFNSLEKIQQLIEQEAISRKWTTNSIKALSLTDDKKSFKLPPLFNSDLKRIESVLFSAINTELVKHKLPGFASVQIPGADFKNKTEVVGDSDISTNNVIVTKSYDPKTGLKFTSKKVVTGKDKNGKEITNEIITRSQVFISWNFKDNKGNPLDIKNYINEDNTLNLDKIPKEVLNIIAHRIPNQSNSSKLIIEIVGFLPQQFQDVIVVPSAITKQMGSDFDVDKLFSYIKEYYIDEEGKFNIVNENSKSLVQDQYDTLREINMELTSKLNNKDLSEEEISTIVKEIDINSPKIEILKDALDNKISKLAVANNNYIEVFNAVLSHPKGFETMVKLLDMNDLKEIAEDYKNKYYQDINTWIYQRDSYIKQQSGNDLISIFALYSGFHAIVENSNFKLSSPLSLFNKKLITFKGDGRYVYNDDKGNTYNRTTTDLFTMLINLAVDNANNPIAGHINVNDITKDFIVVAGLLKDDKGNMVSAQEIIEFINNPIIVELTNRARAISQSEGIPIQLAIPTIGWEMYDQLADQFGKRVKIDGKNKFEKAEPDWNISYEVLRKDRLSTDILTESAARRQLALLSKFIEFSKVYNKLDKIRKLTLSPTKDGLGKNYANLSYLEMLNNDIYEDEDFLIFEGIKSIFEYDNQSKEDEGKYGKYTEWGYYLKSVLSTKKAVGIALGFDTEELNRFYNLVKKQTGNPLDEAMYNKLHRFIKSYVFSGNKYLYSEDISDLRKRLLFTTDNNNSLARRISLAIITNKKLANNPFIKNLEVRLSDNKLEPETITYRYPSKLGIDRDTVVKALTSLLIDPTSEEFKIAVDLINYTFVTGLTFNSNWQQDIDFNYLDKLGFYNNLQTVSIHARDMFNSYIQHNPNLAPKVGVYFESDGIIKGKPVDIRFPGGSLSFYLRESDAYPIVSIDIVLPESPTQKWLYLAGESMISDGVKYIQYKRIPTLGGYNLKKINIVEGNIDSPFKKSVFPLNNIGYTNQTFESLFGRDYLQDGNTANIVLNKIASISKNKLARELSKVYRRIINNFPETRIEEAELREFELGRYENGLIRIDYDNHKDYDILPEITLLHELNHHIVKSSINNWIKNPSANSTEINANITALDNIRKHVINKLGLTNKQIKLLEELREDTIKKKTIDSSKYESIKDYYYLTNVIEFIAKALEGGIESQSLNNIQYDKAKTVLDKIKDIVKKIATHIIESFGFEVKKDSALESVINLSFDLINNISPITKLTTNKEVSPAVNSDGQYDMFATTDNANTVLSFSEIYNKLGNKTESGNVVIYPVYQKAGIEYAKSIGGVFSMRVNNSNKHFGNPFSNIKSEIEKGLIPTKSTKESVEKYIDWVLNSSEDRAKWIREQLQSGNLKDKPIVYYKELGEPSHATALDYLINKLDTSSESSINLDIKPGVQELFESNPELANIGTPEEYSAYLDTIFPDSKVKDIVYRGGYLKEKENPSKYMYFTGMLRLAKNFIKQDVMLRDFKEGSRTLLFAKINTTNPKEDMEYLANRKFKQAEEEGIDALYNRRFKGTPDEILDEIVNFKPEQIHILGSKQDIEGFKEFVNEPVKITNEPTKEFSLSQVEKVLGEINISNNNPNILTNFYNNYYFQGEQVFKVIQGLAIFDQEVYNNIQVDESLSSIVLETPAYVKKIRTNIKNRINSIRSSITKNTPNDIKSRLYNRIRELQEDDQNLLNEKTISGVEEIATRQLNYVKHLLNSSNPNFTELRVAGDLIDMWKFDYTRNLMTDNQLFNTEGKYYKAYERLDNLAKKVEVEYLDKVSKMAAEELSKMTYDNITKDDLKKLKKEAQAAILTLDMSMSKQNVLKALDKIIKLAVNNQIGLKQQHINNITELFADLKKDTTAMNIVGKDYGLFWQKNEKGENTGKLVGLYSYKGDEELSKIKALYDQLRLNKDEMTDVELNASYNDVANYEEKTRLYIDLRYLGLSNEINLKELKYKYTNTAEYKKYLYDQFGEELAEYHIHQAKLKYDEYLRAKDNQKAAIYEDETIKDKEKALARWVEIYNPISTIHYRMKDYQQGRPFNTRPSGRYVYRALKAKDEKGNSTGFYDNNYSIIQNNSTLRTFHNAYATMMKEYIDMLPNNISRRLPYNFLANVTKSIFEKLSSSSSKEWYKILINEGIDAFTGNEIAELNSIEERDFNIRNVDNTLVKNPKVSYIKQLKDDEKIHDLEKMLVLFMDTAINYEYINKVKDKVEVIYDILNQASEEELSNNDTPVLEADKKPLTIKNGARSTKDWIRFTIDGMFYGERVNKLKPSKKPIFDNVFGINTGLGKYENYASLKARIKDLSGKDIEDDLKRYQLAKEIEALRDKLDSKLDEGEISQEAYDLDMEFLETRYRELGGRNLVYQNLGVVAMKLTQMKGMGLNVTAGIANVAFGMLSNIVHANGRQEFTGNSLIKALNIMIKSLFAPATKNKVYNIIKKLDVLFETIDVRYNDGATETRYKPLRNLDIYFIQNKTEYFVQGLSTIATLLHQKVETSAGTKSIWEIFNDDGEIDSSLVGQEWNSIVEADVNNEYTKIRNKIIQVNKYLHGNYDPSSIVMAKKSLIGRMLFQFRSWIPMGVVNRFMAERRDEMLDRAIKGRWVTYYDLGFKKSITTLLKQLTYQDPDITFAGMNDVDVENMRRNLSELAMLGSLYGTIAMLRALVDGDDEDSLSNRMFTVLANQIYRAQQDIFFYIDPMTAYSILRDPVPVTKSVTDILYAIHGTARYYTDDGYRGQPPYVKWSKTMPILNQIPKFNYLSTTEVDDDSILSNIFDEE